MKNKFKILDCGNFYFPIMDKGKKFFVVDTISVTINNEDNKLMDFIFGEYTKYKIIDFGGLSKIIWKECEKEFKNYKNCWIVPLRLEKLGKDYICTIDILRKTK